ncbi:MAG: 23S rRNA (adenine(1618)-N(6))-methyltransferase RlmF [Crocinitomicaceae bacterium]|nr:23S rRNA (adenine(1618)-N(6))-methyltransferase RlmF [Crocinitomicaceae bacterium]
MSDKKKKSADKSRMHPLNKHRERYDFKILIPLCPELAEFVIENIHGGETIDFFNPKAVKTLNKALLMHYYGLADWDIPENYLCPPIPGRADYIHHIAEMLSRSNFGNIPKGDKIKCLDVGVGANCVYPIIGSSEYGWTFVGSDIDEVAIESANKIIDANPSLTGKIECRLQPKLDETFFGIIKKDEFFDVTICNPPFHASAEDALAGSQRKVKNLKGKKIADPVLNFGGQSNELWTEGGERRFIEDLIKQSSQYAKSCMWYTTLVSKQSNVKHTLDVLSKIKAAEYKTIPMGQGNKTSRIVVWTFLSQEEKKKWVKDRWTKK